MDYLMSKGERFVYFWQYGILGDFMAALATAICKADMDNRARLALGFPDEVEAMNKFHYTEGWWPELQAKMKPAQEGLK